ncbi:hypothetical protein [Dyadobacter luticola]|nr:hypothetical protein [Dyadobacter luticola]
MAKWLVLILLFKLAVVMIVSQFYMDPRRDIDAREKLCKSYKPNVVFIGTSRTLFSINPAIFDSLNQQKTRSYNFGMFSLSPQSAFQVAEDLLSESPDVNTIYIELSALNYSTVALKPQQVIPDAIFRANVMAGCSNLDWNEKTASFLEGLNTTLFQMFSIAPQITSAKKALKPENDPIEGNPGLRENGYQPVASALSQTNARILDNFEATQQMMAGHPQAIPNTYYISRINALIATAKLRGGKVIFFYPNNLTKVEYQVLSQVAPFLSNQNLIRLPENPLLNEFFKPENLFDAHHLNQKGAAIFTKFLQKEACSR